MSYIYPLEGQRHFDVKAELTELGGKDKETFRLSFAWDGEHFFELTENDAGHELFDKWVTKHDGTPQPWDASEGGDEGGSEPGDIATEPDAPSEPITAVSADEGSTLDTAPADRTPKTEDDSASEPPAEPDTDSAADANDNAENASPKNVKAVSAPDADDESANDSEIGSDEDASADAKAYSTSSGTTRKRSAKNSTRRS